MYLPHDAFFRITVFEQVMRENTTPQEPDLETLRHSAAHLMAQAVQRLYPETKLTIGPPIEDGFYYDFYRDTPFIPEDLKKIEETMREIVNQGLKIERKEMSKAEAYQFFEELGEPFKKEILDSIKSDVVSTYSQGEFTDLCEGPHAPSTKFLMESRKPCGKSLTRA